jgi:hypothetical protein
MTLSQVKTLLNARGIATAAFSENVVRLLAQRVLGISVDTVRTDAVPTPTAHERFAARMARESEESGIHVPGGSVGHVVAPGTVVGLSARAVPSAAPSSAAPTFVPESVASGVFGPGGVPLTGIRPGSLV